MRLEVLDQQVQVVSWSPGPGPGSVKRLLDQEGEEIGHTEKREWQCDHLYPQAA